MKPYSNPGGFFLFEVSGSHKAENVVNSFRQITAGVQQNKLIYQDHSSPEALSIYPFTSRGCFRYNVYHLESRSKARNVGSINLGLEIAPVLQRLGSWFGLVSGIKRIVQVKRGGLN